jgi:hypothetical protein
MNNKNTLYASLALIILLAATALAVWYAYLTKRSVEGSRTKTFDPLVVPGAGGSDLGVFNNDEITEKTLKEKTETDGKGAENDTEANGTDTETLPGSGSNQNPTGEQPASGTDATKNPAIKKGVQLYKVFEGPVAGFTMFENDKKEQVIRLAERQRGNIIDIPVTTLKVERVTNSTILGVQKAFFTEKGTHVVLQHLDTDDSILTLSTPVSELSEKKEGEQVNTIGSYLPVNIQSLLVRGETILFSTIQEDGTLSVATTNLKGERTKRVWKSPLHGWNIAWSGEGTTHILVNQRPSLGMPGYVYRISLAKNSLEKVFGDEPGITSLESGTAAYILKTLSSTEGYTSFIYQKNGKPVRLKRAVFPEKCTWSPQEYLYCGIPVDTLGLSYPDMWMQGARMYADTIVKINPRNGEETAVIETVKGSPDGLDVTAAHYSADGKLLLFIDKTTATLWGLSLE